MDDEKIVESVDVSEPEQPEARPVMSEDGIGLKLEEVRALILMQHELALSKDDPILIQVTILNAFINELQKEHRKHEKAMIALLSAESGKLTAALQEATGHFANFSSDALREAMGNILERMTATRQDMFWLAGLVIFSAIINAVALWVK